MLPLFVSDATTHSIQQTGSALGRCFFVAFLGVSLAQKLVHLRIIEGRAVACGLGQPTM
jgi:hypothetical protein